MNERGRKTNTNYVDSDTESGQNSRPNYVLLVEDRLGQRSGIVTVVVEGVYLPNALIDSAATCNLLGQGTWSGLSHRKSSVRPDRRPRSCFLMEIQSHS